MGTTRGTPATLRHASLGAIVVFACAYQTPPGPGLKASIAPAPASTRIETVSPARVPEPATGWMHEGNIGPHIDWVTDIQRRDPKETGSYASPEYPVPEDMPARCVSLYETLAKKQPGFAGFSCAVAPSGDVWAVVKAMEPVKGGYWSSIPGYWQVVLSKGASVFHGPPQTFSCFAGGPCDENPARCYHEACHGRLPGGGFWFHDLDADGSLEVFLHGREEVNTSDVDERSVTLWQRAGSSIRLHPLSQSVSIVGVADCNGDGKLELAVNPYRVAGDDFA